MTVSVLGDKWDQATDSEVDGQWYERYAAELYGVPCSITGGGGEEYCEGNHGFGIQAGWARR